MGESKRRKQVLGDNYGTADINSQVANAWETINLSIKKAKQDGNDYVICQCCRNDKGFHYDAIEKMRQELKNWQCPSNVPMLIQMFPKALNHQQQNSLMDL